MLTKTQLHTRISYTKSLVRLAGYALLPFALGWAAGILFLSELIGIAEEVFGA